GPRTTELRAPLLPFSAGTGVGTLLTGRLVLKVTHPDVPVQRRAIVDLQSADLDVAAELRIPAEGQFVSRGDRAFDRSLQRHIGTFEQGLDCRAACHVDVAGHPDLALDAAVGVDGTVIDQLAFQDVSGTHRELFLAVAFDLAVFHRSRTFGYRLLNVHALPPTWNFLRPGTPESGAK